MWPKWDRNGVDVSSRVHPVSTPLVTRAEERTDQHARGRCSGFDGDKVSPWRRTKTESSGMQHRWRVSLYWSTGRRGDDVHARCQSSSLTAARQSTIRRQLLRTETARRIDQCLTDTYTTIIKTIRLPVTQAMSATGWPAGRWRWAWSKWAWSASQEQTLNGKGARVYTAHRDWLGVVTGISAASTGGFLVKNETHGYVPPKILIETTTRFCNSWTHGSRFVNKTGITGGTCPFLGYHSRKPLFSINRSHNSEKREKKH